MAVEFLQDTNINGTFTVKDSGGGNELLVSDGLTRVYSTLRLDLDLLAGASYGTSGQVLTSNGVGNGVSWETPSSGGISGSGSAGQVTTWSGSSAVTGENNLWWDSTNDRLGIGTATPQSDLDVDGIIRSSASSTEYGMMYYNLNSCQFYSRNGASKGNFDFIVTTGASSSNAMKIWGTGNVGQVQFPQYGDGNITGTAAKMLAVDSAGLIIEETLPTGGGSMDDWVLNVDNGTGTWPTTITDGETVQFTGGTNISTAGSFPSAGVNRVTISQDQYYQTFHFAGADKNLGGTYYMEWDSVGSQTGINYACQYIPLRNGDFTKIKWFSSAAVAGNITMTLYNNTTSLWASGNFTSSANTAVNFTPNVSISENQRLNLVVVYPSGYGGEFNITTEFAWDL